MTSMAEFEYMSASELALPADAIVIRIPGQIDKLNLVRLLARELHFPAYFRANWDAFEECLRDLSWCSQQQPIVLLHLGLPLARRADQRAIYVDILRGAIEAQRQRQGPPLRAIFPPNCRQAIRACLDAANDS